MSGAAMASAGFCAIMCSFGTASTAFANASRSEAAFAASPFALYAVARANRHNARVVGKYSGGSSLARISSHIPNRTITSL